MKIINSTANIVSSTESLTSPIEEHIISLKKQYDKVIIASSIYTIKLCLLPFFVFFVQ